jgi:DHA1 family multidrug resistance protein-like MFS transporter
LNESLNEPLNQDGWKRNLLVLWIAQFIAMIGMTGVIPFLPLYVRELGVSPDQTSLWSGFIIAAPFATAALLTPLWGAMGDRYGQKLMVMRAVAGLGLTVAAMGLATNVWVLFVLRILQGAVSGFIASTNAFVSSNTPSDRAGYALGTLQTSISAGAIVGPLVGGAISDAFGFQMVFFVVGGLCTLSLVTVYAGVREQPVRSSGRSGRVLKNLVYVRNDPTLMRLLLILLIGQTGVVLTGPIFPYYLEQLGAPSQNLGTLAGMVVSLVGLGTIASASWWGKRSDRYGYAATMRITTVIVAAGMLAQVVVPSYEWIFPIRGMIGLAVGALLPLSYSELTRRAPVANRGGIMGLASSATLLGNLLGPILCAGFASVIPLQYIFLVSASLIITVHVMSRGVGRA